MNLRNILLLTAWLGLISAVASAQVANISRTDLSVSGTNITSGLQNASPNTYFQNDGRTVLVLKNNTGAPVTGTVKTQKTSIYREGIGYVSLADEVITVPSASTVIAGPYPTGRWNTVSDTVQVSMSTAVGVSATSSRLRQ
ncbi:hypothetical protein EN866_19525 [Mesorhizobium sp. M2D.F.Ca.ET.223.01.1.1]|uniref:hypothetical protein n=1 Tax=unclassified Mesorhizobium TaxID=325217 RepID=UPI000FCBDF9F|nr:MULTISPECIES: hypothetical protein [unclassified Mesorhizobium]TGP89352.1 hypothetical protein EN864_19535 [bacterium M00.F.Ca.ET.221.01.1.1]TGP94725.1 hypothetical protein EN865_15405 [bacterium M00.F.Ca.ET.222.01.1.1]RVD58861.1 hypothetical protein EN783_14590 [Mesorhizobium sp. M2D.F.Ca.ET.140.01.1.1]TGP27890.1 hypothetical protein EN875_033075 [Mesorhizobium sp. M2D.F.Ca.ET.232.01.1.1]TGP75893.1 hypothetical protein EN867_15405 [Mesorhizobium sp. M2D.F.Ca.ET.224.01.1.1]